MSGVIEHCYEVGIRIYHTNSRCCTSGGFKVGGARGKTKNGGPSDDVIILSQP